MRTSRIVRVLCVVVVTVFSLSSGARALGIPIILSAAVDAATNELRVDGTDFGPSPTVILGSVTLTVKSATTTQIVATLPTGSVLPGTYVLKLKFTNGAIALFALSLSPASASSGCGTTGCAKDPLAVNIGAIAGATVGNPVIMSATVSDPDVLQCGSDAPYTYEWRFVNAPAGSTVTALVPSFGAAPMFIPDVAGIYTVRVTVTGNSGRSASAIRDVIVGS